MNKKNVFAFMALLGIPCQLLSVIKKATYREYTIYFDTETHFSAIHKSDASHTIAKEHNQAGASLSCDKAISLFQILANKYKDAKPENRIEIKIIKSHTPHNDMITYLNCLMGIESSREEYEKTPKLERIYIKSEEHFNSTLGLILKAKK